MTDTTRAPIASLVETLRAARATERTVFEAFDAADRDTPPADGEWSPKDIQAHLGAWRRHMTERLAAIREGRPEPEGGGETDATNAVIHAERADWPWDRVAADAEASATDLIAEIEAADDATLAVDRTVGSIMGNGAEHTIIHAGSVARPGRARIRRRGPVRADRGDRRSGRLAAAVRGVRPLQPGLLPRAGRPPRRGPRAPADRVAGRGGPARFRAEDSDLVALRDEIPELARG